MNELQPISIVNLFETDKEGRKFFADSVVTSLLVGNYNPLSIHYNLKCMEAVIKDLLANKDYKDLVLEEASKNGKSFMYKSSVIETKETGVKYDWEATGDEQIKALLEEEKELKKKIKARQEFLKAVPEGGVADGESGNMIYRAPKSSSTTIAVTLK